MSGLLRDDEVYRRLMVGAGTVWQVEAAARLVFYSESLRQALCEHGFVVNDETSDASIILFEMALQSLRAGKLSISKSDRAVLQLAASIAGKGEIVLRHLLPDLDQDSTKLVAEAIMYGAGFMDGEADPTANDGPNGSNGPNWAAHELRISGA